MSNSDIVISKRNEYIIDVHYTITNNHHENLALANLLYHRTREGIRNIEASKVYIEIINEVIVLSKKVFTVPLFLGVEYPEIPYFTVLKPGQTFEEDLLLNLPLYLTNPYHSINPDGAIKRNINKIKFELGIVECIDKVAGKNFLYNSYISYTDVMQNQKIIQSEEFSIDILIGYDQIKKEQPEVKRRRITFLGD